jgi:hypothetical protein
LTRSKVRNSFIEPFEHLFQMSLDRGIELAGKEAQLPDIGQGGLWQIGQLPGVGEQSLFAWVKPAVDRKENTK